jgi:hypothetical protein
VAIVGLAPSGGSTGQVLTKNSATNYDYGWATPASSGGTVTSVALSAPGIFTVSGSPVTTSGTLTFTLNTQSANLVWAGPTTGAAAAPTFRSLVAADLPNNGANPTVTASDTAVNGSATTWMRSDAAPPVQKGSSSVFGIVKVDGTTITSSSGVISVNATGGAFHGCRVYNDGAQSIPNNSTTAITFAQEEFDTDAFHSTSSNTSRITIPTGLDGYYRFTYGGTFAGNSSGIRIGILHKNGGVTNLGDIIGSFSCHASNTVNDVTVENTAIIHLSAGDYIEFLAYQNSGGSLNIGQAVSTQQGKCCFIECQFIGV